MRRFLPAKPMLVGLPALVLATSCVSTEPTALVSRVRVPKPETDGRVLLRKLALSVPDGVADRPVPLAAVGKAAPGVAPPPFVAAVASADDAARASECLTAAVYYEARSEPVDGQRAVAQVVLNRVRDRAFPNSVCGVVFQGSTRHTGCQFSFTCDGSMDRPRDWPAWDRARAVAQAALAGAVYAPVGPATYYHASSVLPWWASSLARIGSVGSHIFYRWSGALERALAFRQSYAGVEPTVGARQAMAAATETQVAGVEVHRGAGVEGGVTVHRGANVAAVVPVDQPAATPADAAVAGGPSRVTTVAGVRIHVGFAHQPAVRAETDPT